MSSDTGVELVWFAMAFMLVISAVVARRLPLGTVAKMALAWTGIFGAVFLVIWAWQIAR